MHNTTYIANIEYSRKTHCNTDGKCWTHMMTLRMERSASKESIFVIALLVFTILCAQQRDVHHQSIGVVVTEAFVAITTPANLHAVRWRHHKARRAPLFVKQRLAKSTHLVFSTTSEEEEVAISNGATESITSIQVDNDDVDVNNLSSAATVNDNTDSSTVVASTTKSPSPSATFPVNCDEDDTSEECVFGSEEILGECLPEKLVTLPIHTTSTHVNQLLRNTEQILRNMHINSTVIEMSQILAAKEAGRAHECIYANNYVDLGKIDTYVYFDTCDITLIITVINVVRMCFFEQSLTSFFLVSSIL